MPQTNNNSNYDNFKTAIFADCLANSREIFQLIDEVFPIDSCRHYKVLPLKLVDSDLIMGMLDPLDQESLNFVSSIARVYKYNLEIQLIDEQTFQIILASYPQSSSKSRSSGDRNQTVVDDNFNPDVGLRSNNSRRLSDSAPTIVSDMGSVPSDSQKLPELPVDLDLSKESNSTHRSTPQPQRRKDLAATLFEIPPEFLQQKPQHNNLDEPSNASETGIVLGNDGKADAPSIEKRLSSNRSNKRPKFDDCPTIISEDPTKLMAQVDTTEVEIAEAEAKISELISEISDRDRQGVNEKDFLSELLPELSWQQLLERAFQRQTEQINLDRYSDRAKIVAIKDKLPQSTIERVPLAIFDSLIKEIKQVAKLTDPIATTHKIALERFYEQERILLRLEFVPPEPEEKIKIQILRGKTLKIYEQQQMDRVSDRALQLAKQLEKTLRRIQVCFDSAELNNLKELQAVQSRINHQLRLLDK